MNNSKSYNDLNDIPSNLRPLKTIYLSGKMSGLIDHGFTLFNRAAKALRSSGFIVKNPAENPTNPWDNSWEYFMKMDVKSVVESDFVVVLHNWKNSKGANIEVNLARDLRIPIYTYPDLKILKEESPVEEAMRLVCGERQDSYGHPYNDFLRLSYKWTGTLFNKLKPGCKIEPEDVPLMMVDLKTNREINKQKKDNITDAHGYLITYDMVLQKRKELESKCQN